MRDMQWVIPLALNVNWLVLGFDIFCCLFYDMESVIVYFAGIYRWLVACTALFIFCISK